MAQVTDLTDSCARQPLAQEPVERGAVEEVEVVVAADVALARLDPVRAGRQHEQVAREPPERMARAAVSVAATAWWRAPAAPGRQAAREVP